MLQQILKDMYIEPEVLEALSEEQKKILFLKMREEQVRRWKERQADEEKENTRRPKRGSRKSVSWLLGGDGEVLVRVIGGEQDKEKSPKRLLAELRQNGSLRIRNNNNSEPVRSNQVDQNSIQLLLKKSEECSVPERSSAVVAAPEEPRQEATDPTALRSSSSSQQDPKDDSDDSGTAEDDLKDPSEEENSGSASDDLSDSGIFVKSHCRGPGLSINGGSKPRSLGTQSAVKERPSKEKPLPQESLRKERDASTATSSASSSSTTTTPSSSSSSVTTPSSSPPQVTTPSSPSSPVTTPSSPSSPVTTPSSSSPQVTTPSSSSPSVTTPSSSSPHVATPSSSSSHVTTPSSSSPHVTTPSSSSPHVTTPSSSSSHVTTPSSSSSSFACYGSRVAQLRRSFAGGKPPLPAKPAHLQRPSVPAS
ncbi:uncharacterized protein DDB_G0271670 [Engraulis encrasicolus]|uniref:uncharacterized protein DDB_G0271670 n=1 Tax=Engraulis encrasicolus TaxID=184585 RepID=UPI002FD3B643